QIRTARITGKDQPNTTKRKAQEEAKRLEHDRMTINKIWELYQQAHPEHKSRKRDISRYDTHIRHRFGDKTPDELVTADIDNFKNDSLKGNKSNGTIQRVISQFRAIINFAVKRNLCPQIDPGKLTIESIHVDDKKTEMLTPEQMTALLKAIDAEEDQNAASLIRLALFTGMRKGALLALKWEDCDFTRGIITLRGESAKNGETEYIPMNESARSVLQTVDRTESPYVFPGKDGKQRADYRRIARRVKKRAGLPADFRPLHGLRHSFASFLASSGKVDLYTLQKLLTHSSPQMTQRYAHLADEALRKAADVADGVFSIKDKKDQ
ncbi:MAG: site-specific integrase, partial [Desulfovibrio sp.]|nr:site-specific integrase [Desulfovibrio sp.]